MNQKRTSRQQLAHLSASLFNAYRVESAADLSAALHAIAELNRLVDEMKESAGQLLDRRILPAGLQCHFCNEGGIPNLHILSDPLSQANSVVRLAGNAMRAKRAAAGVHLLAIPVADVTSLLEFTRRPLPYLATALDIEIQDLNEWLGEKPVPDRCAWEGCEALEFQGTAMAQGLDPLQAARDARLKSGDRWYCAHHEMAAFRKLNVLSDDLCRRITRAEIEDVLENNGDSMADLMVTDRETDLLTRIGFLEVETDEFTLTDLGTSFFFDWIALRTRRRVAEHRASAEPLKQLIGDFGFAMRVAEQPPHMPDWPGAEISRRRSMTLPVRPRTRSWKANKDWAERFDNWHLATLPWAHWTPAIFSAEAADHPAGYRGDHRADHQAAHGGAEAASSATREARATSPETPPSQISAKEAVWIHPAESTLCSVWAETGKVGVCKNGSVVCEHFRGGSNGHVLCVGGIA